VQSVQVNSILGHLQDLRGAKLFVFFGNNTKGLDEACRILGRERIAAGHLALSGKRDKDAVVYADDPGRRGAAEGVIGEWDPRSSRDTETARKLCAGAGVRLRRVGKIEGYLKTRAAWTAPVAAGFHASEMNLKRFASDASLIRRTVRAVKEGIRTLLRLGIPVTPLSFRFYPLLPDVLLAGKIARCLSAPSAEIGIEAFGRAARLEMREMMRDLIRMAEKAGVRHEYLTRQEKAL
jgi:ketopantoate reductase